MTAEQTYRGGCDCGKVRFEATADLSKVLACNCSICTKRGLLLTFVPPQQFVLLSGEDALADYRFHKKVVHHLFCTACGVESFARGTMPDGTEMVAINARCLEGVEPATLDAIPFDGRSV